MKFSLKKIKRMSKPLHPFARPKVSSTPRRVDTTAFKKKNEESRDVARVTIAANQACDRQLDFLSVVPYPAARLQTMRSPFKVDKRILAKFNNFDTCDEEDCGIVFQMKYPRGHFIIELGPATNAGLGERLNSPLFSNDSGGYALKVNGIVGATIWLCVGDLVTITYQPGNCRGTSQPQDLQDFLAITGDPFGGQPSAAINQVSPYYTSANMVESLGPKPIFGTQKIYREQTVQFSVPPFLAFQRLFLVESAAVATFVNVIVLNCCD